MGPWCNPLLYMQGSGPGAGCVGCLAPADLLFGYCAIAVAAGGRAAGHGKGGLAHPYWLGVVMFFLACDLRCRCVQLLWLLGGFQVQLGSQHGARLGYTGVTCIPGVVPPIHTHSRRDAYIAKQETPLCGTWGLLLASQAICFFLLHNMGTQPCVTTHSLTSSLALSSFPCSALAHNFFWNIGDLKQPFFKFVANLFSPQETTSARAILVTSCSASR